MKKIIVYIVAVLYGTLAYAQSANESIRQGNKAYAQGIFDQAENSYRKGLEAEPGNTTALYNLSNALHKQKKYEDAIRLNEQIIKSTSDTSLRSVSYYNQGVSYTKLKNLEASIESYKNALRLNPNDQQARENLQKALLEQKQKQQQQQQQKKKPDPKMSPKEAQQRLDLLNQKEKDLQQRMQDKNKKQGGGQAQDW